VVKQALKITSAGKYIAAVALIGGTTLALWFLRDVLTLANFSLIQTSH
jgi:hypothetical protein